MTHKASAVAVGSLLALVLGGLSTYVVRDSIAARREISEAGEEVAEIEQALQTARQKAREVVREKLQRDGSAVAQKDAAAAGVRKEAALRRRAVVRRFFGTRGVEVSESYRNAAAMPETKPSEENQEIIDLAGEAASEEDIDTAAEVLEAALKSKDPRARLAAVEMLSGLGEAGLVDISEFLRDPHPEVASLAADRWTLGIQGLTDEAEQVALVKVGYLAVTDEDQLRSFGGTLMLVQDSSLAVGMLSEVIREGSSVQRDAAKEAYETVTGEKWVDEKTAEAWLEANHTPPEPEEGDAEATADGESEVADTADL